MERILIAALFLALATPALAGPASVVGRNLEHVVSADENLYTIAVKYGLAAEHLGFANGIPPMHIDVPAGQRLLVPRRRILPTNPPRDGIVVNLPERGLYLFRGGRFLRFCPASIGMPGRFATPRGTFRIINRALNPTWFPPAWAKLGEDRVPPGPYNPLGDRWLGLTSYGLGLHSTNNPPWIGAAVTHACIRTYPWMMHYLYDRAYVGLPVRIEYEPAKLGYDSETGQVLLATFPDVYGIRDPVQEARREAEAAGLLSILSTDELRALAETRNGVAQPVHDVASSVTVRGKPIVPRPRTLLKGGFLWIDPDVVVRLGGQVSRDRVRGTITARRAGRTVRFAVSGSRVPLPTPSDSAGLQDDRGLPALLILDRPLVPARTLFEDLDVDASWSPESKELELLPLPPTRIIGCEGALRRPPPLMSGHEGFSRPPFKSAKTGLPGARFDRPTTGR